MYTEITMYLEKENFGMNGEPFSVYFEHTKQQKLKDVEAMNYTITAKDMNRVMYRESWDGRMMVVFVMVKAGEEEEGEKILKCYAKEYFGKLKKDMEQIIELVSDAEGVKK